MKFTNKASDLTEGLVEYIIALGNDCMRSTEFSESIIARLEGMCDESYREETIKKVQTFLDGFVKIQKRCQQVLIDITLSDVKPALIVLHCDQWYEQDVMKLILGTFEDYSDDFQKHMSEYLYNKVTTELMDRFLVLYLESFRNKNAKFKMPIALDRMKTDIENCVIYFSKTKSAKRVNSSFEIIQKGGENSDI